jgi:hypothetical protein
VPPIGGPGTCEPASWEPAIGAFLGCCSPIVGALWAAAGGAAVAGLIGEAGMGLFDGGRIGALGGVKLTGGALAGRCGNATPG